MSRNKYLFQWAGNAGKVHVFHHYLVWKDADFTARHNQHSLLIPNMARVREEKRGKVFIMLTVLLVYKCVHTAETVLSDS